MSFKHVFITGAFVLGLTGVPSVDAAQVKQSVTTVRDSVPRKVNQALDNCRNGDAQLDPAGDWRVAGIAPLDHTCDPKKLDALLTRGFDIPNGGHWNLSLGAIAHARTIHNLMREKPTGTPHPDVMHFNSIMMNGVPVAVGKDSFVANGGGYFEVIPQGMLGSLSKKIRATISDNELGLSPEELNFLQGEIPTILRDLSKSLSVKIVATTFTKNGVTHLMPVKSDPITGVSGILVYDPDSVKVMVFKQQDGQISIQVQGNSYGSINQCGNGTPLTYEAIALIPLPASGTPKEEKWNGQGGGGGGDGGGNVIWYGGGYTPKYEYWESSGWVPTNSEWCIPTPPAVTSTIPLNPPPIVPGVPEPETYAMMLAGLGVVGFAARLREQRTKK